MLLFYHYVILIQLQFCSLHIVEKTITGPSDVGGTCPSSSFKYTDGGDDYCCCSSGCCWNMCRSNPAPQECLSGVPGAEWGYNTKLSYYQAVLLTGRLLFPE